MIKNGSTNNKNLIYVIAGIAATGGLLFGFDTGVISGALLFISKEWHLDSVTQGILVSSVLVGAILGAAFSGKITDFIGRRKIIIITAIIFFIGSLATAIAPGIELLIAGRIVIGMAIGCASFAVPLYISEISPTKARGALVSLNQLAITIGIVVSYLVDAYFASFTDGWRYMFAAGVLPAIVLGIGMLYLFETPRWLMSQNNEEKAREVLKIVNTDEDIENEILQMKKSLEAESGATISELFKPWLQPALIIGIGLMFIQQMTGINTVIYYAPTIFNMAGFESNTVSILATVGVGIVNVLLTIVSIKVIDDIGRKPLLYIGLTGIVISLAALGLAFQFENLLGASLKWVTVGSLLIYIASFAVSLGPICWLVISEIYPLKIRGVAMSIATVSNWTFNFIVALTFLILVDHLGKPCTFWLYAVIGIAGIIFCLMYVPETKGHTLEEIENHWLEGKHPTELR